MFIDELLLFNGIEPVKESEVQQFEENKKKETILFTLNKNNEKLTISQLMFEMKENEDLEKKNNEKYKLKNIKKIDLAQFIQRELDFEQKKQYKIEKKKFKKKEEEIQKNQKREKTPKNTIEICKTQKYPPLYLRQNDVIKERKVSIENLKKYYDKFNDSFSTLTNNNIKSYRYIKQNLKLSKENNINSSENKKKNSNRILRRNKSECSTQERFSIWLNKQEKWAKKKEQNLIKLKSLIEKKNNINNKKQLYFSQGSINILNSKGEYNNFTNENFFYKLNKSMEKEKIRKQQLYLKTLPSFQPIINNEKKHRNITPRYFNYDNNINNYKKKKNKIKNRKYIAKSFERRTKKYNDFDITKTGKIRNTSVEHWSKILFKMKNMKPNEILYHLNIMPSSAWNENTINQVNLQRNNKNIIHNFI